MKEWVLLNKNVPLVTMVTTNIFDDTECKPTLPPRSFLIRVAPQGVATGSEYFASFPLNSNRPY